MASSAATVSADVDNRPNEAAQDQGWEGLASFLFGPDWFSIPLEGEGEDATKDASSPMKMNQEGKLSILSNGAAAPKKALGGKTVLPKRPLNSGVNSTMPPTLKGGKGKQLINIKGNEKVVSFSLLERKLSSSGTDGRADPAVADGDDGSLVDAGAAGRWHAPYLNTVSSFPLVTNAQDVANPHRLPGGTEISLSLHDLATEMEACREQPLPPSGKRPRKGSAKNTEQKAAMAAHVMRLKEEVADKAMRVVLRIPDDVCSTIDTIWGSIQDNNIASSIDEKKSMAASTEDAKKNSSVGLTIPMEGGSGKTDSALVSKVKFNPLMKQLSPSLNADVTAPHDTRALSRSAQMPAYVPNFLPPFPANRSSDAVRRDQLSASATAAVDAALLWTHHREKRKLPSTSCADEEGSNIATASSLESRDSVRRAVIGLGKSVGPFYWGSDIAEGAKRLKPNDSSTAAFLSEVTVAPSAAKKSGSNVPSHVAPLGRASGSRVRSFILYFSYIYFNSLQVSSTYI